MAKTQPIYTSLFWWIPGGRLPRPTQIRYMRVVFILIFAITLIVVPLDLRLFPSNERSLIYLGHGTEIVVIGALFAISFVPYFRDRHMAIMAMLAVFFAAIYALWNVEFIAPDIYVCGGVLVIVAIYVLLPFDFVGGVAAAPCIWRSSDLLTRCIAYRF